MRPLRLHLGQGVTFPKVPRAKAGGPVSRLMRAKKRGTPTVPATGHPWRDPVTNLAKLRDMVKDRDYRLHLAAERAKRLEARVAELEKALRALGQNNA